MKRLIYMLLIMLLLVGCSRPPSDQEHEQADDETSVQDNLVNTEGEVSVAEEALTQEEITAPEQWIIITGDILNVRDIPSVVGSAPIGTVVQDSVYLILEEAKDEEDRSWYAIEYDTETTGWVAGWFTEPFDNPDHYMLTGAQWSIYHTIKKQMVPGKWYKDTLSKKSLNRSLVYDFDMDGAVDSVNFQLKLGEIEAGEQAINQSIITVEGQELVLDYIENGEYGWGLTEFGVIDIDQNDHMIEFYIKEGELADRVIYSFYRINQGQLTYVANMSGELLGAYGDGKLYYWGGHLIEPHFTEAHNPDMAISYYDIKTQTYVTTDQIVGQSVPVGWKVILYATKGDVIDGAPSEFDSLLERSKNTRVALLEEGDVMTVLEHDHNTNRTRVSTKSGYEGWIGGFHMVWD